MAEPNLKLFRHQAQFFSAPWNPHVKNVDYFFHVAGYAAGKSYGDCGLIVNMIRRYHDKEVTIGIGGTSLMHLKKTLLLDLFRIFNRFGIPYDFDKQSGIIQIDKMQFMCIGVENPDTIYGYNYHAFIDDEIDELPHQKAMDAHKAISERTRLVFPDGRQPFMAFSSTAQGYKGLYQIVEERKEKREPSLLIRGETRFNTLLSKKVIDRWYRMYTDNERLAFLEGRFVNLTTGRVYYAYDEVKHFLRVAPFKIEPSDCIHVGQDLNTGFSRAVAVIIRGDKIYAVKRWSFPQIGLAPKLIRQSFPANEIRWYPDATAAEIIAGYSQEVRAADLQIRMATFNPSRLDRIFFVNKLFASDCMFLVPGCEPLSMALKIRQYDDKGDPEKGKGPDAPDHDTDALEYVVFRLIIGNTMFRDILQASRIGRVLVGKVA